MNVLMLANNNCVNDSRVKKTAEAVRRMGNDVSVVCTNSDPNVPNVEIINGIVYKRICLNNLNIIKENVAVRFGADPRERMGISFDEEKSFSKFARFVCLRLRCAVVEMARFVFKCFSFVKRNVFRVVKKYIAIILTPTIFESVRYLFRVKKVALQEVPDIVHAHDLTTLLAGAYISSKTGAQLIYDSHELEMGRNGVFNRYHRFWIIKTEGYLIRRANSVITVSESISEYLSSYYKIPTPVVIHNAPIEGGVTNKSSLRSLLNIPKDDIICISIGKVTINRGLDVAIEAMSCLENAHLVFLGHRDSAFELYLKNMITSYKLERRVHFVDPVPHHEVISFASTADVSLILVQNVCLSYSMCFPNKLLESVFARLPIVSSRLVELERFVDKYSVGVTADETDPRNVAEGIQLIVKNYRNYVPSDEALKDIHAEYGWEYQEKKLQDLYMLLK